MELLKNLYVCLFNVYSTQKMREMAQLIIGFNLDTIIIARAVGSAAQAGVPDVNKMLMKKKKNLIILKDLPDVIEIINPSKIYLMVPKPHGKPFTIENIITPLKNNEKVLLVIGGSEPGLSKKELDMGERMSLQVDGDLGTIGTAAIVLHEIYKAS